MSAFKNKVLQIVKLIPKGQVASYGQVALMAGIPKAALQVGYILQLHGDKEDIPWWRVINSSGRISIKNPEHAPIEQKQLLEKDGVLVDEKFNINIKKYRFLPDPNILEDLELNSIYIQMILEKYY